MRINFTIPGKPQGKGRPRVDTRTGKVYTPKKTSDYEARVRILYQIAAKGYVFPSGVPICIQIMAYYPMAKKMKADRAGHYSLVKPDIDNVSKIVLDGLNGVAYHDDNQIAMLMARKMNAPENGDCVEVSIYELSDE